MNREKAFLFLFFLLTFAPQAFCQISDSRKRSLDSIVSSMELPVRKDLELAQRFLDSKGQNDEEKVWLYFGYLGTYFKYDRERMKDLKAPFYNPELTAKRSKGVCRDFSRVFEYLCVKSNIPCFSIIGKTKMGIFEFIGRKFHRMSTQTNHQWNVVRVNGTWMLMDPTWTHIASKTKIPVFNPVSKTSQSFTLISVDRTYYNPDPVFMAQSHAPIHPAFSLLNEIPTYKTIRKKAKKQRIYKENYACNQVLDSIWVQKNTLFSRAFVDESYHYSSVPTLRFLFNYELDIALVKPDKSQPVDARFYDERISRIKQLETHINAIFGVDLSSQSDEAIKELKKRKAVYEKQLKPKKR
ncbi:transglutaminase domain-containing protein [Fluviicola sp.]|uniref:transglutaminase domain-containing protein n=1 Tax=Fluviicola sp. TaxID=1917219 RepID=UPI0031DFFF40